VEVREMATRPRCEPEAPEPEAWDDEHELGLLRESLRMSPEERLREGQRLWDWYRKLHPRRWKPFVKSFDSFDELERWKSKQQDPELW
jgi:hypothetical protein